MFFGSVRMKRAAMNERPLVFVYSVVELLDVVFVDVELAVRVVLLVLAVLVLVSELVDELELLVDEVLVLLSVVLELLVDELVLVVVDEEL